MLLVLNGVQNRADRRAPAVRRPRWERTWAESKNLTPEEARQLAGALEAAAQEKYTHNGTRPVAESTDGSTTSRRPFRAAEH